MFRVHDLLSTWTEKYFFIWWDLDGFQKQENLLLVKLTIDGGKDFYKLQKMVSFWVHKIVKQAYQNGLLDRGRS